GELELEKEQLTEEEQMMKGKQTYLQEVWTKRKQERLSPQQRMALDSKVEKHHEQELLQELTENTETKRKSWELQQSKIKKQNQLVLLGSILFSIMFIGIYLLADTSIFINLGILIFIIG